MPTTLTKSGPEQRIDDGIPPMMGTPSFLQLIPLAGGTFALVWRSDNGAPSIGIQMFDANGQEAGPEFSIVSDDNDMSGPEVVPLSGGGFVVAWTDDGDIGARLFSATGSPGASLTVATATQGDQRDPQITELSNGNFVISWGDRSLGVGGAPGDSSGSAVKAQMFMSDGTPVGGEILVNTTTASEQTNSHVAALPGGGFVAAWTHQANAGPVATDTEVRAQMFDAAGAKVGGELSVNTTTAGFQGLAEVVPLANGDILIVFTDGADEFTTDLRGRVYSPAGVAVSAEFLINTATDGRQSDPQILARADGSFVIAWADWALAGHVRAQRFAADGARIGSEIQVNTTDAGADSNPSLVGLPDGGFAVAWTDRHFASERLVRLQAFDTDGLKIGPEQQVNTGMDGHQTMPELAAQPDGRVLATYIHANDFNVAFGVIGQFFAPGSSATPGDDTLTGSSGPDDLQGLGGNDHLSGLGGNDNLDGGTGADTMDGGSGNDSYHVDNAGDVIVEAVGGGFDTVFASADYTLTMGAEVEVLQPEGGGSGTNPLNLFGNEFNNTVAGTNGVNYLRGGGGNDILIGGGGDDILGGDTGTDTMYGGTGNDTYFIDTIGDIVTELSGEGNDRVATAIGYILASGASIELFEAVTLSSTTAMDLTGNAFGQTIAGNNGVNILRGEAGQDILFGYGGSDYLIGGPGDDTMYGGAGDDTYYIDNDSASDVIVELAGEGNDRIAASISYTLGAGVSIEVLEATNSTATNAMDLTGNGLNNVIGGNNGVNTLRGGDGNDTIGGYDGADTLEGGNGDDTLIGGAGNDTMSGGDGSDKYYVTEVGDVIVEPVATGVDTLASSVSYTLAIGVDIEIMEPITFNATDPLTFTGNEFGTTISGNNGANTLDGGLGGDILQGLGGQDLFAFTTAPGGANIDLIADFLSSFDRIVLENAVFTGLTPGGLFANQFVVGAQAADADDRIIYNSATGALLFDVDGLGGAAAVQFATVGTGLNITANDFLVI